MQIITSAPQGLARTPGEAALLGALGPVDGCHIVIVGHDALDLMCALIGRGCAEATLLRPGSRPVHGDWSDIAIIAHPTGEELPGAIDAARRALGEGGTLAVVLDDERPGITRIITRILRQRGFSAIRVSAAPDGSVVTAEVPSFGLSRVQ